MYWFAPRAALRPPLRTGIRSTPGRTAARRHYGFPALDGADGGAKAAFHAKGSLADPDGLDREIHPEEVEAMRAYMRPTIPALGGGRFLSGAACTYTRTSDERFVPSAHPRHPQVPVACGFSGHIFKFVPAIGEFIADLAIQLHSSFHRPARRRRGTLASRGPLSSGAVASDRAQSGRRCAASVTRCPASAG
ncbi:FAD-dependent oxidoreductase [Streptomyces sp. AK04-3B]|uniref:FAD-dependent oxidoreductase n=1 Tax=Streptomyces sp. AK04-3B TaxID=3028650 RepID=UPI0039F57ABC